MAEKPTNRADGECYGEEFFVNKYWRFEVPSLDRKFDTYEAMKDAIERTQKAKQAVARKKPMSLAVVTCNGDRTTIAGVHAGHGKPIVKPVVEVDRGDFFYPDVQWIRDAIAEADRLRATADRIDKALKPFAFKGYDRYSFDPSMYASEVERLEKEHASKLKAAEKSDLEKALKKVGDDD